MSESLDDSTAFERLQQQLQIGDDQAQAELFHEYSQRLFQLSQQQIHPALLKRFDGDDVVQSVFRTFFRRQAEGHFQLQHAGQLWRLLVTLTLCKTRSHARKHTADKRNVRNDQPLDSSESFVRREASAEDALALWEEIDAVLTGLPPRAADILGLRLEGLNRSEIAKQLQLSRQTIYRILDLVESRLQERFERYELNDEDRDSTA